MNNKRIWTMSLFLGIVTAFIAYILIFSKDSSTTASVQVVSESSLESAEEEVEEVEPDFSREISNPMVEVAKGKRAISIKISTLEQGLSGYIAPNSQVDIIAYETTIDDKTKKKYKSATLVVENVKVLASGKSADTKAEALHYETVTVEVTPEEGVMLGLASKDKDGFYLMLRNEEDQEKGKKGIKEIREVIKEDDEGEE